MDKSSLKNKKKPTISQRISAYLKEIKTEALGVEKKVAENIHHYFRRCGKNYQRPPEELLISIKYPNNALKIQLFHKSEFLSELTTKELVDFFTGGLGALADIEKKASLKVIQYLHQLAQEHGAPVPQLDVLIVNCSKLVLVEVFCQNHFRKNILLKTLIQQFQ